MNSQLQLTLRRAAALVLALMLAVSAMVGAPLAHAQDTGGESSVQSLKNAEFRWGINKQSAGPSHGPGHNFFSAGDIAGALTEPNQEVGEADWRAKSGNVTIEKRSSASSLSAATWLGTKTDQSGTEFAKSSDKYSGLEMVFSKGVGQVDAAAGTAQIKWTGTASVVYYSGLVYLTVSDPVLKVSGSRAVVTATMGGHRSDREDSSVWAPLPPTEVVIANLPVKDGDLTGEKGFSAIPEYRGVTHTAKNGDDPQNTSVADWGSFPGDFVDFASDAGAGAFWYSSGGSSDSKKVPLPIVVSWNSSDPAEMPDSGNSGGSKGLLGQVIDDTVEDILRSAGTDVSDTAAAWMDEAWKPLQPHAVNAAQEGAETAASGAEVAAGAVSQVDEVFEEYYEETYIANSPMTAGTVGGTLASIPASSSGGSPSGGAGAAAVASAPVSGPATVQVAANTPLGADVVYAQTSASREAGNPAHQWQWWVGAVLLALAAVLFYQTVRRKD